MLGNASDPELERARVWQVPSPRSRLGRQGALSRLGLAFQARGLGPGVLGAGEGRASRDRRLTLGVWLSVGASEEQAQVPGSATLDRETEPGLRICQVPWGPACNTCHYPDCCWLPGDP